MNDMGKIVSFERGPDFLHARAVKHRDRDPMEALNLLHRAIGLSPREPLYRLEEAELLSELGCPLPSILVLSRTLTGTDHSPAEGWFGLACNLFSLGYFAAAADALLLCLSAQPEGEYAEQAVGLLASLQYARAVSRRGERQKRRAETLLNLSVRLMQEERFPQARGTLTRALVLDPGSTQADLLMVQAELKCGLPERAAERARVLLPNLSPSATLQLALWLAQTPGQEALADESLATLERAELDADQRSARLHVLMYLNRRDEVHRLLPDALRLAAPYDLTLLNAAAADSVREGQMENAEKYWRSMLRLRPADGIAGWYLEHLPEPGAEIPLLPALPAEVTRALRAECETSPEGARLLTLSHWALDALENDALTALCPALALCPDEEAEGVLREALAHPMLGVVAKQAVLEALRRRGAKGPYLYCNAASVRLLPEEEGHALPDSRSLARLLTEADEAAIDLCPHCRMELVRLWAVLSRRLSAHPVSRPDRLAPALLLFAGQKAGRSEEGEYLDEYALMRRFRITRRRLRRDAALLRHFTKEDE